MRIGSGFQRLCCSRREWKQLNLITHDSWKNCRISKRWLKCRKTDCLSCGKDLATTTGQRNLKAAAQQVMEEYNGVFPDTFEEIKKLKGIGSYTAGAISSFVYHQQKHR